MIESAISFKHLLIKTLCIIALSLSFINFEPTDAKQVTQAGAHWTIDTVQTVSEIQPYNSVIQTNYHANYYIDITINFDAYYSGSFTFENKHIGSQNWFPNFIVIGAKCNSQSFHSYSDGLYETYNLTFTNTNCIIIRIVHSWTSISFSLDPSTFYTKDWVDGDYVNVKYVNSTLNNVVDDVDLYDKLVDIDTNITGLKSQLLNSITTTNTQLATLHDDMINLLNAINNINLDVNVNANIDGFLLNDYLINRTFVNSVRFNTISDPSSFTSTPSDTDIGNIIRFNLRLYSLSSGYYYLVEFPYSFDVQSFRSYTYSFSNSFSYLNQYFSFFPPSYSNPFYMIIDMDFYHSSSLDFDLVLSGNLRRFSNNTSHNFNDIKVYEIPKVSMLGSSLSSYFSLNNSNLINLKLDTITSLLNELLQSTDTGSTDPTVPDIDMPTNFLDISHTLSNQDEIETNYFNSLGNNFNEFVLPEFNSDHTAFAPLIAIGSGFGSLIGIFFDSKLSIVIYLAMALIILRVILL